MRLLEHIAVKFRYKSGIIGDKIRRCFYRKLFKNMGKNVEIKDGVIITYPENISIGRNVVLRPQTYLNGAGGIEIGSNVLIAAQAKIISMDHNFERTDIPIMNQKGEYEKVVIEDDVWIASGATILKGVRIGKGSVIGANALITKNVKPYSVMIGVNKLARKRK